MSGKAPDRRASTRNENATSKFSLRYFFSDVRGVHITRLAGLLLGLGPCLYVISVLAAPGQARPHGDLIAIGLSALTGLAGVWMLWRRQELPPAALYAVTTFSSVASGVGLWATNSGSGSGSARTDVHPIFAGIIVLAYIAASRRRATIQHAIAIVCFVGSSAVVHGVGRELISVTLIPAFWYSALGIVVGFQRRQNATLVRGLRRDAWVDKLTGIENRTAFLARTQVALENTDRGATPVVLVVDLDDFREINDSLGHAAGDRVLSEVGTRLEAIAARNSTSTFIARLGGDEFGVLLTDATPDEASATGKELVATLRTPFVVDDIQLCIDASVGIAGAPQHGATVSEILRVANDAMSAAKTTKTGVAWATTEAPSGDTPRSRLVLLGDLRRAIAEQELRVYYQPKVRLEDRALHGVESLVRWPHPVYGFVSPAEFVAAAEQTGLIHELTDYVLETTLAQCRSWMDNGLDLRVAVNVSTRNLLDPGFADRVQSKLAHHRVAGEYLVIEITEGTLMQQPDIGREAVEKLKSLGVEIALDDFGTGFSSLSYLNVLPVDELKFDRSFLAGISAEDSTNRAIVHAGIRLGEELGMRVIVEGVETDDDVRALTEIGCEYGQGYLFGRPVPPDEITALVAGKVRFAHHRRPNKRLQRT